MQDADWWKSSRDICPEKNSLIQDQSSVKGFFIHIRSFCKLTQVLENIQTLGIDGAHRFMDLCQSITMTNNASVF